MGLRARGYDSRGPSAGVFPHEEEFSLLEYTQKKNRLGQAEGYSALGVAVHLVQVRDISSKTQPSKFPLGFAAPEVGPFGDS